MSESLIDKIMLNIVVPVNNIIKVSIRLNKTMLNHLKTYKRESYFWGAYVSNTYNYLNILVVYTYWKTHFLIK